MGRIKSLLPGRHNVSNSLAAIALALELGIDLEIVREVLGSFRGAKRRLDILYDDGDIMVIDDYAHHPSEIKATLEAIRNISGRRIICAFEPHRYTRTRHLESEFGDAFDGVDHLVLTDIYSAGEPAIEGVSGMNIYRSVIKNGHKETHFVSKGEIVAYLMDMVRGGDIVAFLGAGDITKIAQEFKVRLSEYQDIRR